MESLLLHQNNNDEFFERLQTKLKEEKKPPNQP